MNRGDASIRVLILTLVLASSRCTRTFSCACACACACPLVCLSNHSIVSYTKSWNFRWIVDEKIIQRVVRNIPCILNILVCVFSSGGGGSHSTAVQEPNLSCGSTTSRHSRKRGQGCPGVPRACDRTRDTRRAPATTHALLYAHDRWTASCNARTLIVLAVYCFIHIFSPSVDDTNYLFIYLFAYLCIYLFIYFKKIDWFKR